MSNDTFVNVASVRTGRRHIAKRSSLHDNDAAGHPGLRGRTLCGTLSDAIDQQLSDSYGLHFGAPRVVIADLPPCASCDKIRAKLTTPRTVFMFLKSCDCPMGLVEGSVAKTMQGAWRMMAGSRDEEREMHEQGITCVQISFTEYETLFRAKMLAGWGCPHAPAIIEPES